MSIGMVCLIITLVAFAIWGVREIVLEIRHRRRSMRK